MNVHLSIILYRHNVYTMKKIFFLLCLLLTYANTSIQAQNKDIEADVDTVNHSTKQKTLLNVFVGYGSGNHTTTSYLAGFTLYDKHLATTIRYIHHESGWFDDMGEGFDCAVMFGPALRYKQFIGSASAGVSMISISNGYNYELGETEEDTDGLGFPLSLQLIWTPIKHIGVGIYAYATFIKSQYMLGWTGTLSVLF